MHELLIIQGVQVRKMPTAYARGVETQQGSPVSEADRAALQEYDRKRNGISDAQREARREHMKRLWQHSPRTRKRT